MITKLGLVTVYVTDVDEALKFYVGTLGLKKTSDEALPNGYRWVTVAINQGAETQIVLQDIKTVQGVEKPEALVGNGSTWVFNCDDCKQTCNELKAKGVEFLQEPQIRPYGVEAVFADLYGNPYVLIERAANH